MGSNTTKLDLYKPTKGDGADSDDFVQVQSDVNTNMDIIDQNINLRTATSGSRPSGPFPGAAILETDTGRVLIWDSSILEWVLEGSDNTAKGRVARLTNTADGPTLTSASAETLYFSTTFVAEADRRYWVEVAASFECTVLSGGSGQGLLRTRYAAGASVTNTGTQLGADIQMNAVNGTGTANSDRYFSLYEMPLGLSGTYCVGLFLAYTGAAGDSVRYDGATDKISHINIRDVGVV